MAVVKNGLPPIHPGEFLREALVELGLSQAQFARAIGVAPMRISHLVNGLRPVSAELALLFGRALRPVAAVLAEPAGCIRSEIGGAGDGQSTEGRGRAGIGVSGAS